MKIEVQVGDAQSGEWNAPVLVSLRPYAEVFAERHPGLPPISEGFGNAWSVEGAVIETEGNLRLTFDAHYQEEKGWISFILYQEDNNVLQVRGPALDGEGGGLEFLFQPAGCDFPVALRCVSG